MNVYQYLRQIEDQDRFVSLYFKNNLNLTCVGKIHRLDSKCVILKSVTDRSGKEPKVIENSEMYILLDQIAAVGVGCI